MTFAVHETLDSTLTTEEHLVAFLERYNRIPTLRDFLIMC